MKISKKNKDFYFQILEEYQNGGEYHPYTCGKCPDTKLKIRLVCNRNFQFYCDCGYSQYILEEELERLTSVILKKTRVSDVTLYFNAPVLNRAGAIF